MNTQAVVRYGHETLLATVQPVPLWAWEQPGVCGVWSLKAVIAHLASFEWVFVELLTGLLAQPATPLLDRFATDPERFNQEEVARRADATPQHVLADYAAAYAQAAQLLAKIPVEMRRQQGTLAWYGNEYDLDDFIVYTFYGHKREHSAQIALLAERVAQGNVQSHIGHSHAETRL